MFYCLDKKKYDNLEKQHGRNQKHYIFDSLVGFEIGYYSSRR